MFKFDKEVSKKLAVAAGDITFSGLVTYGITSLGYHSSFSKEIVNFIGLYTFAATLGMTAVVNYAVSVYKEDKDKKAPSAFATGEDKSNPCTETVGMDSAKKYFKIVNK